MLILLISLASAFSPLTFEDIESRFLNLSSSCPFIRVSTSQLEYSVPSLSDCENCETTIAWLSNADKSAPQIYLSGALHGNERLGPAVVTELASFLCEEYALNPWVRRLVDTRYIILTPTTNAQGYYRNQREEKTNKGTFDPNRDFPYIKDGECMETVAARTVASIFEDSLVRMSITFHGGTNVIGYPWGAPDHIKSGHKSTEAPDLGAFDSIAQALVHYSQADLTVGPMTDTVYDVSGGMEDWAYGAGWENEINPAHPITNCTSKTYDGFEYESHNPEGLKQLIYLVETDGLKSPKADKYGEKEEVLTNSKGGLISQFLRMSLAFIDLAEPYILIDIFPWKLGFQVNWEVWGCIEVDSTFLYFTDDDSEDLETYKKTEDKSGGCKWGKYTKFTEYIETIKNITVIASAKVDQKWILQKHPDPKIKPVTHVVRARTEENYSVNYKENAINGNDWILSSKVVGHQKLLLVNFQNINSESVFYLKIIPKNNTMNVWFINRTTHTVKLVLATYGDLRGSESIQGSLFGFLCNNTEPIEQNEIELENCSDPYKLVGRAVFAYNEENQLLGKGVLEMSTNAKLPTQGGVCVTYAEGSMELLLRLYNVDGEAFVEGYVIDKSPDDQIVLSVGHASTHVIGWGKEKYYHVHNQKTSLGINLLGARLNVHMGTYSVSCVIGIADPDMSNDIEDYIDISASFTLWWYALGGFAALILFAIMICLLKEKNVYSKLRETHMESLESS